MMMRRRYCTQVFNSAFCFCSHKDEFSIVPVLVGALSENKELEYGKLLAKYLADPSNLFIISSDFCHWGTLLNNFCNKSFEKILPLKVYLVI